MPLLLIEPRDPLIVRDGRPFGASPGARAASLPFPFPSTTAGAVRTRAGLNADGVFSADPKAMRAIAVRGPLLVEIGDDGAIASWLVPAPADAALFDWDAADSRGRTPALQAGRLVPLELPDGALTNLPADLLPVGLVRPVARKPASAAPRFWRWDVFERWLGDPPVPDRLVEHHPADLGHDGPVREQRLHAGIDHASKTAADGALFQTGGLEFTHLARTGRLGNARRLALAIDADIPPASLVLAPFGGERRLAAWRTPAASLPTCLPRVREAVIAQRHCRVVLLTPAHFAAGFRPDWLLLPRNGVTPHLVAVACQRPQVVSGWDIEKGRPKPTRRLAPAGSVYFLRLDGSPDAIAAWVDALWMACVSDDAQLGDPGQDRCDGFGLAAIGAWDGAIHHLEDTPMETMAASSKTRVEEP